MGIQLASNFDVNAALPLDSRMVVADLTARDAIVSGRRFEGMCVYVVADTKTYQLQGGILNADWAEYGSAIAAATFVEKFSGDGGTLVFTLANDPLAIENTQVYIDGVYQQKTSSYTLSTTDIEFIEAPPIGTDNIEVIYTTPTGTLVIPDNYITSVHIADDAVTTDKILSLDAAKLTGTLPAGTLPTSNVFKTSSSGSFNTTSASYVDVTNLSQAIICSGTRVVELSLESVTLSSLIGSTASSSGKIAFVRNGTVLNEITSYTAGTYFPPCSIRYLDNSPPAGSNTYKLQIRSSSGVTVSAQDVILVVRET